MDQMLGAYDEFTKSSWPLSASKNLFLLADVLIPIKAIGTESAEGMGFGNHTIPSPKFLHSFANLGDTPYHLMAENDGWNPISMGPLERCNFGTVYADLFHCDQNILILQFRIRLILNVKSVRFG